MARINRKLSKHAKEELAKAMSQPWFKELIENLRYAATFAERSYSTNRPISELEHQALNGSFREGASYQVERILTLADDDPKQPEQLIPFGTLTLPTPDPKATYAPVR